MTIRLHGNGFIQLDLGDNRRLHIWSPDLPKAQNVNTPIHDHTFDFISQVLCGELHHVEYDWMPDRASEYTVPRYVLLRAEPTMTEDTLLVPVVENGEYLLGDMRPATGKRLLPGQQYSFDHGLFHETTAHGLTATIMTKTRTGLLPFARIACRVDEDPDNEFSRYQWTPDDLWPFVHRVVGELGPDLGGKLLDQIAKVSV